MYPKRCKILYLFIFFFHVHCDTLTGDFDDDPKKQQISPRSDRSGSGSRIVTGTFRFRRVMSGDGATAKATGAGWDIEGCYCETGTRCSCNGNRNRVRMFVRSGSQRPPMPGSMGIPLPSSSMFDLNGASATGVEMMGPEGERLVQGRRGCFCNGNGCSGSDCATMNGCVCSQGACWGSACDSRIPINSATITSGNLLSAPATSLLSNPLQLVRNAVFASNPISVNGQSTNQQQNGQVQVQGECSCNNQGCIGSGCANMNGCFCVGSNCWGNSCSLNSLMQSSGNLLANPNLIAVNQAALSNLLSRLTLPQLQSGALALGPAAGNLINIPGLVGPGGIFNSLLPGGFGGGANPFDGQGMQVVKGVPVKRIKASRAKRIRGKATRVPPGLHLVATRGHASHAGQKRRRPAVETFDESTDTLTVVPHQRIDPVIGFFGFNQFNDANDVTNSSEINVSGDFVRNEDEAIRDVNISDDPQESVDVFTFTDEWLKEINNSVAD